MASARLVVLALCMFVGACMATELDRGLCQQISDTVISGKDR